MKQVGGIPETISGRVCSLMSEHGWAQRDLVAATGLPQSTIASVMIGDRNTRPGSLPEIALALGVDAYWLKTGVGDRFGPTERRLSDRLDAIERKLDDVLRLLAQ